MWLPEKKIIIALWILSSRGHLRAVLEWGRKPKSRSTPKCSCQSQKVARCLLWNVSTKNWFKAIPGNDSNFKFGLVNPRTQRRINDSSFSCGLRSQQGKQWMHSLWKHSKRVSDVLEISWAYGPWGLSCGTRLICFWPFLSFWPFLKELELAWTKAWNSLTKRVIFKIAKVSDC